MDDVYGRVSITLLVAPSISSCEAYFRRYLAPGLRHPLVVTHYGASGAPVTQAFLDFLVRA